MADDETLDSPGVSMALTVPARENAAGTHGPKCEDDDMPPLVDLPPPLTYTFATNMTPLTYGSPGVTSMADADADIFDFASHMSGSSPPGEHHLDFNYTPDASVDLSSTPYMAPGDKAVGVRHPKKSRSSFSQYTSSPSYIPRPPNAFILFRSSFVRAQRIPGRIEGNHSTLSKIVGMCWKNLSRDERGVWEERARVAQAEHRKRYPDWRFRTSGNYLNRGSGLGGGGTGTKARVKERDKDKDKDPNQQRNPDRERGKEKEKEREQMRCEKIVDLLAEGKEGSELAAAIDAYDLSVLEELDERKPRDPSPRGTSSALTKASLSRSPRSQTVSLSRQHQAKHRKRPSDFGALAVTSPSTQLLASHSAQPYSPYQRDDYAHFDENQEHKRKEENNDRFSIPLTPCSSAPAPLLPLLTEFHSLRSHLQ